MKCKFTILILLCSACFLQAQSVQSEKNIKEIAIQNAIDDFSKHKLFKKDSVFLVSFLDSVYTYTSITDTANTNKYVHATKSVKDKYYDNIVVVVIFPRYDQFYYTDGYRLIFQYSIKNGKLFYWDDYSVETKKDVVAVFKKYNLLHNDYERLLDFTNGHPKVIHYYFCKNNLSKFKRIITRRAIGTPPKIRCK